MALYRPTADTRHGATAIECAFVLPATFFLLLALVVGVAGVFRYQEVAKFVQDDDDPEDHNRHANVGKEATHHYLPALETIKTHCSIGARECPFPICLGIGMLLDAVYPWSVHV
mgnify:CR=1 FL=1